MSTEASSGKKSAEADALLRAEAQATREAEHGAFWFFFVNGYSTFVVFLSYLISLETVLSICLSIGMTVYLHETTGSNVDFNGDAMDWVLLSFAVITPISATINMAFNRRERALTDMASLRATCVALYTGHADWGWNWKIEGSSRPPVVDSLDHSDQVMRTLLNICSYLTRYLTLPNASKARHRTTNVGMKEAERTLDVATALMSKIMDEMGNLSHLCEHLKRNGMPGNEAARMRQWERFIVEGIEKLRVVKKYRTPQGLRSFGRLFSCMLPPFYAPYYAELSRSLNSLGVGVAFSVLTAIALTSLFETASQMEDPFIETSILDGIQGTLFMEKVVLYGCLLTLHESASTHGHLIVKQELVGILKPRLLAMRKNCFPGAAPFEEGANAVPLPETKNQHAKMRIFTE